MRRGLSVCLRWLVGYWGLFVTLYVLSYFGAAVWHYFAIPFQIPNLFRRLFGEGALSAALIPVYTDRLSKDREGAGQLACSVVTLLVIILGALTLVGYGVIAVLYRVGDGTDKHAAMLGYALIMLPYMILICTVAILGGLLNVHRHFAAPAAAPIILNVTIIAAVVYFRDYFGETGLEQLRGVAWAVIAAGFLQLVLQYFTLARCGLLVRPRFVFGDADIKRIVMLMAPMVLGLSVMQINTLLDGIIAMFFSATPESGATFSLFGYVIDYPVMEGSVAHLYGAQRLYQFPLGVFGVAIATAIFPMLSSYASEDDRAGFSRTFSQGLRMVIFIGLPATAGMMLVALPLCELAFGRKNFSAIDTGLTAWTLVFYALGIGVYCLQMLVARAFYALKDPVTPVRVAVRVMLLNVVLNCVLIFPLGTGGLALSTAVCAAFQVAVLTRILIKRGELVIDDEVRVCLRRTIFTTLIMSLGAWFALPLVGECSAGIQVLVQVLECVVVYGVGSRVLGSVELRELWAR